VAPVALCEVRGITYTYPGVDAAALSDFHLTLEKGEMVLVTGPSGGGKSTLLRLLAGLVPEFYGGVLAGKYYYRGQDMRRLAGPGLAREMGMVFQDPERQLIMTGLERELAFGLENIGIPPKDIERRIDQVIEYFNLDGIRQLPLRQLSGGQKQKVVLAATMACQPEMLLLDEPTSQLDPEAAAELMSLVRRLNEEKKVTVIIGEQRLERVLPFVGRVLYLEGGRKLFDGAVQKFLHWAVRNNIPVPDFYKYFTTVSCGDVPLDVVEAKQYLPRLKKQASPRNSDLSWGNRPKANCPLVEGSCFSAGFIKDTPVLKDLNLQVYPGEFLTVLGSNGAGKSTLLKALCGLIPFCHGDLRLFDVPVKPGCTSKLVGKVGYLSQNPNDYLFRDTVEEELLFTLDNMGLPGEGRVENTLKQLGLWDVRQKFPRDLSGGQRQRVALASVLVSEPRLLLLDEPTRGLDLALKKDLGLLINRLQGRGMTVIMVTHDVEFVARYGERVVILKDGAILADGDRYRVLGGDQHYASQLSRVFWPACGGVLTYEDAVAVTGGMHNAENF